MGGLLQKILAIVLINQQEKGKVTSKLEKLKAKQNKKNLLTNGLNCYINLKKKFLYMIFVTISFIHTHSSPVVRQKETLITPAHKGRYCMSDSSLFKTALQSTANFKHHIIGALKQKDFYIFFKNLGWLLRLIV